jgi:hypothetical protein
LAEKRKAAHEKGEDASEITSLRNKKASVNLKSFEEDKIDSDFSLSF